MNYLCTLELLYTHFSSILSVIMTCWSDYFWNFLQGRERPWIVDLWVIWQVSFPFLPLSKIAHYLHDIICANEKSIWGVKKGRGIRKRGDMHGGIAEKTTNSLDPKNAVTMEYIPRAIVSIPGSWQLSWLVWPLYDAWDLLERSLRLLLCC
jgi:hypothetical protein